MTSTLAKSAAVAMSAFAVIGLAACGNHTKQTPDQVFIASYNSMAPNDQAKATTAADQKTVIGYGHDFCNYMKHSNLNVKASKNYLTSIDGLPDNMAGAIFVAATDDGSLCPVQP